MNKKERIQAALLGEKTDKLPYAFWTHFPGIDLDPVQLANTTYDFYHEYDLDFIKTANNGMYGVECFGCTVDYSEISKGGVAKILTTPIKKPSDWHNISALSLDNTVLSRELLSLQIILKKVQKENVPVIFTVFSPFTLAHKISQGKVIEHIDQGYGPDVKKALAAIAETTALLAKRVVELGADGIFFASQLSSYDKVSDSFYQEYGVPYDLKVFRAAEAGWFNVLHAHGSNIMFKTLKDYPVNVLNWHVGESLSSLDEARDLTNKCLMGGLERMDITNNAKDKLYHQIYESFRILQGRRHILTPGCVIRYPLNKETLAFIKDAKNDIERLLKKKGFLK